MAFLPKNNGPNSRQKKAVIFHRDTKICRQRFGVAKIRPHEDPRFPHFTEENRSRNSVCHAPPNSHPLIEEIKKWTAKAEHLLPPYDPVIDERHSFHINFVENSKQFDSMLQHLLQQSEIALDLEVSPTDDVSYYNRRYMALCQISTNTKDFVIDPFLCAQDFYKLRSVLQNPEILKIVFDGAIELQIFQLYFRIFPIGVIDMKIFFQMFVIDSLPPNEKVTPSLVNAVEHYFPGTKLTKLAQAADFRTRPLHPELQRYARADSHFALRPCQRHKQVVFQSADTAEDQLRLSSK
jgi:hypothetical protein